jgi:site-specific DNA recombinase
MDKKKNFRCAIYTRKSHDDGSLEQEFNSLSAQRESAENYIASQKANGWKVLPQKYDDGGFSGGNMERPALKRLLGDVKTGLVDIIVVYKIDRLSRSLLDFMKLAEMLEQHDVSFVSVTQDINTSTSAGRMMLNILMTFSQYEREIIAERILISVAGAKRRGKHCGGPPVLGYDADSEKKKLIINHEEAKIVKLIFERYIALGSARDVAKELNEKGYRTKKWESKKGKVYGGGDFTPDYIYRTLSNPLYIGRVRHHDKTYPGEHDGIIAQNLWDNVQAFIAKSRKAHGYVKKKIDSPFKGLLKCGYCGGSLGITYTKGKNRTYTYYVCIKNTNTAVCNCPLASVPAGEADKMILAQLGSIIKTPSLLAKVYEEGKSKDTDKEKKLLKR